MKRMPDTLDVKLRGNQDVKSMNPQKQHIQFELNEKAVTTNVMQLEKIGAADCSHQYITFENKTHNRDETFSAKRVQYFKDFLNN